MNSVIIDGFRWRIQERNSEWSKLKSEVMMLLHHNLAHIVVEYCLGTVAIIPWTAVDRIQRGSVVVHQGHALCVLGYDLRASVIRSTFGYKSCLQLSPKNLEESEYDFDHIDYINFILTGYDKWIFGEIGELILLTCPYDEDTYKPCCQNGDAKKLAEILLMKLRSQIVGSAQDQKLI